MPRKEKGLRFEMLTTVALFDTSIATDNVGDEIIMDSVRKIVEELYPSGFVIRLPTHDRLGPLGRKVARNANVAFVGGTNLLCANWFYRSQWKVGATDFWRIGHPVLLGVGWQYYQRATDPATSAMLRSLLSKSFVHSVRDNYTLERVKKAGVQNVVNTCCPTMWNLTEAHCASIPKEKGRNAVITLTAYRYAPDIDRAWVRKVLASYENVYFWPQMHGDYAYAQEISEGGLQFLEASLTAFDRVLDGNDIDFIGTRLHGGIRALQKGRRTVIIEVDNRAAEIAKDTGLPTVGRGDVAGIGRWIDAAAPTALRMPWKTITTWKSQFTETAKRNAA